MNTTTLQCHAHRTHLADLLAWVHTQCSSHNLPPKMQRQVELALEEALVNIIEHTYHGAGGPLAITCQFYPKERIEFTLQDQGEPFSPLERVAAPDPHLSLEERKEGGLGVFLMTQMMDLVRYEYVHPYNILRLSKNLT